MNEAILCVDDERTMLTAYQRFLESEYRVETAFGGAEALTVMADRGPFAVVVSDLEMPGMNGIAFLAASRAGIQTRFACSSPAMPTWNPQSRR